MQFPSEWKEWNMLPPTEYMNVLACSYELGMENASEHDRNGCFHWWLKKEPSKDKLLLLAKLAALDPDTSMRKYLFDEIRKSENFDNSIEVEFKSGI